MDLFGFASSALGSILGAETENRNTDAVNAANAQMLERQIEANKETMQNRHQWEVADLRAAGLNPLMSTTSPTGTLSAPNASPAQKSNSAQAFYQMADLFMKDKELGIAKTNAEANLTNARTAENALAWQKNIETRRQDWIESEGQQRLNQDWQTIVQNEMRTNSDVRLSTAQAIGYEIENKYKDVIMRAEQDRAVQQVLIDYALCQGQLALWAAQGEAALRSAAAQENIAYWTGRLNSSMEALNYTQRDKVAADIKRAETEWKGTSIHRQNEITEASDYQDYHDSDTGRFFRQAGFIMHDLFGEFGIGGRFKNVNLHTK